MIVVPFTGLRSETRHALFEIGATWRVERLDGDTAYFDLLSLLWAAGEEFTIVEHDIVPTAEALASFDSCDSDWCAAPYEYVNGWLTAGLGCTRFRGELLARHPDVMATVAGMSDHGHPPRHWCRLDAWLQQTLTMRGETRCESHPQVGHVMADPGASAHGCYRAVVAWPSA